MTPYYADGLVTIYNGDAREVLPTLERAHALVSDPPYGLNTAYGRSARTIQGDTDMDLLIWIWGQAQRLLPNHGWAGVFSDWRGIGHCQEAAERAGLTVPTVLVWDKGMPGMGGSFRPQYEMFVVAAKGTPTTPYNGGNVLRIGRRAETPEHPHEKPLSLMHRLISWLVPAGGVVIDPFAGSGSTLRAAKDLGRMAIGIEIEEKFCEVASRRCRQETLDLCDPVLAGRSYREAMLSFDLAGEG